MATSTFRNKNIVRPKKTGAARRRRLLVQRRRLASLGVPEEKLRKLTTKDIRTMLKHPVKVAKEYAQD